LQIRALSLERAVVDINRAVGMPGDFSSSGCRASAWTQFQMNEQLLQRVRQCPNLPTLPTIAMQVLELTQRSDADIAEIARIISKDAALSGKILRTVNSSFYGRSQAVGTISGALVILGLQSVKTLVLGFSLVTNLNKKQSNGFKHLEYWKRSIYAATAARSLAARINMVQQEEAFLAALLMDIGMLVLDIVLGDQYGDIYARSKTHAELLAAETRSLEVTHAAVGGILAESWKLPPLLSVPIAFHHIVEEVSDQAVKPLTQLVALAGRCADVFVEEDAAQAIADVRRQGGELYKLSEADCDAMLADIGKRTKEIAPLFDIKIAGGNDFEAILKRANEALVEITLQTQQQSTTLQQQNQELIVKAVTDGLTGLANRARFDEVLAAQFASIAANPAGGAAPLSLLMIDIDKFKSINDRFGHPAGDTVIKAIGRLLKSAARQQDLAARYGGEEMVLLLPGTPKATAAAIAETVRRAICAKPVQANATSIPVSASIGVATFELGGALVNGSHLTKAADLALYSAKHNGRNCVRVFSLKPQVKAEQKSAA
jgi:diguanylate cyclase (GGDEF)-like protein